MPIKPWQGRLSKNYDVSRETQQNIEVIEWQTPKDWAEVWAH